MIIAGGAGVAEITAGGVGVVEIAAGRGGALYGGQASPLEEA
jgi:hypothetical protein